MDSAIKICGLTRASDVETALLHGADMLGFIVEANSPRRLCVEEAAKLSGPAFGCARRVAVTVDADENLLDRICSEMQPDILQMHGKEVPKWLQVVKGFAGLEIIKAVPIAERADLAKVKQYESCADYILLDAKPPKGNAQQGGHGLSFDWKILEGFTCSVPLILAGGLGPDNIRHAKTTGIKFFDVSSGVEARAGVKDPSLIAVFMHKAHERYHE